MEIIRGNLQSSDWWTKQEGLAKLCRRIKASQKSISKRGDSSEYDLLSSLVTSEDRYLCHNAAQWLVRLATSYCERVPDHVHMPLLCPSLACDQLLTALQSTPHGDLLIASLTDLVSAILASSGSQTATLQADSHPHVRALRTAPLAWRCIMDQLHRLVLIGSGEKYLAQVLQYVTSFVHVLLRCSEADVSWHEAVARAGQLMCHLATEMHSCEAVRILLRALASSQHASHATWSQCLEQVAGHVYTWLMCERTCDMPRATCYLSHCYDSVRLMLLHCLYVQSVNGGEVSPSVCRKLNHLMQCGHAVCDGHIEAIIMSHVLHHSSALSIVSSSLLDIVRSVACSGRCGVLARIMMCVPLLRASAVLSHHSLRSAVADILSSASAPSSATLHLDRQVTCQSRDLSCVGYQLYDTATHLHHVIVQAATHARLLADCQMWLPWLKRVHGIYLKHRTDDIDNDSRPSILTDVCRRTLAALILSPASDTALCSRTLLVVRCVAAVDTALCADVYHCVLQRLSTEHNASLSVRLLHTLPRLAYNKELIPGLVRLFTDMFDVADNNNSNNNNNNNNSSMDARRMRADAVTLLARVWRVQPRCLSYLSPLLALQRQTTLSCQKQLSLLLAQITAICDICLRSGESGSEFVSTLSVVLSQLLCNTTDHSSPSSLSSSSYSTQLTDSVCCVALRAVEALCRCRLLDLRSTWRVMAPLFNRASRRPRVMHRFIELISLTPSLHVASSEYQQFSTEMATVLWNHVLSHDDLVASAAARALSKLDPRLTTLSMLPTGITDLLPVLDCSAAQSSGDIDDDDAGDVEEVQPVPGVSYIHLLRLMYSRRSCVSHCGDDSLILTAGLELLQGLIGQQLLQMPRGLIFSALQLVKQCGHEPNDSSYLGDASVLAAVVQFLRHVTDSGIEGASVGVVTSCLKCLARDYDKPLPPLDFSFLTRLLASEIELAALCVKVLAVQCCRHESAELALSQLLSQAVDSSPIVSSHSQCIVNAALFDHIHSIGRCLASDSWERFVHCHLSDNMTNSSSACRCMAAIEAAIRDSRLVPSNRMFIVATLQEIYLNCNSNETQLWSAIVSCVCQLPVAHVDELSSWPPRAATSICHVTQQQLTRGARVRATLASQSHTDAPMNLLNNLVETAADVGLYTEVQGEVYGVIERCRDRHQTNAVWLSQMMTHVRTLMQQRTSRSQSQEREMNLLKAFTDIIFAALVTWSPLYESLCDDRWPLQAVPSESYHVVPSAVLMLVQYQCWSSRLPQIRDFLKWLSCCDLLSHLAPQSPLPAILC